MSPASRSRPLPASSPRPSPVRARRSSTASPATTADQHVVCFDTETTGLHRGARLVEIAAIKFVSGREVARMVSLVDPGERIPYEATAVHGITATMVRGEPRAAQVLKDFHEFIEGAVLVAHFAAFDLRIINDELQRARLPLLKNAHVCTRNLARAHLTLHSYRLEDVARHLGVLKGAQQHRALGDVLLAAAVYHKLQERIAAPGVRTSIATAGASRPSPRSGRSAR